MTRQLILVRHGQTVHNVAGIAQGWNDSDLSELGRRQVQRLAERIARMEPSAIYSSPLGRALSTAEAIRATTGLAVTQVDDLREMSYGGWEGCSFLEVRRRDEELYQRWINDAEAACPEGESHGDVRRRLERAIATITNGHAAEPAAIEGAAARGPVVVVTHGTAIRIAATALLDLPVMASRHFAQDNAAMNVFVWRGDRWILKVWNDATHCSE